MRRRAGERAVLRAVHGASNGAGADHVASVTRRNDVLARLWWQTTDGEGTGSPGYIAAEVDDRLAVLEHRQAPPPPDQPAPAGSTSVGTARFPARPPAQLRLVELDTGTVLARAASELRADTERWTLHLGEGHRLEFTTSLRRRPRRLRMRDHDRDTTWTVEPCRAPSGWAFDPPPDLTTASILLPLWLAHLLDTAHVLGDRPWPAPPTWQVMLDETGRHAPGGFTAHVTGGGGFAGPAGGA